MTQLVSDQTADASRCSGRYQNWHQWRQVIHGPAALADLGGEMERLGRSRAVVVTTPSLVREAGVVGLVTNALGDRHVGTFGASRRGAPGSSVLDAARLAAESGADILVSVGGGSVVDTAKGAALATSFAIDDADGLAPLRVGAQAIGLTSPELPRPPLPIIAVPTTLSGAEYTGMIGITDEVTGAREPYRFDALAPETVVLDPRATVATPARLWGGTGVKALSDAFEQYATGTAGPAFDPQLLAAIRLFADQLLRSAGGDLEARLQCQIGAWLTLFATFNVSSRCRHQRRPAAPAGGAARHRPRRSQLPGTRRGGAPDLSRRRSRRGAGRRHREPRRTRPARPDRRRSARRAGRPPRSARPRPRPAGRPPSRRPVHSRRRRARRVGGRRLRQPPSFDAGVDALPRSATSSGRRRDHRDPRADGAGRHDRRSARLARRRQPRPRLRPVRRRRGHLPPARRVGTADRSRAARSGRGRRRPRGGDRGQLDHPPGDHVRLCPDGRVLGAGQHRPRHRRHGVHARRSRAGTRVRRGRAPRRDPEWAHRGGGRARRSGRPRRTAGVRDVAPPQPRRRLPRRAPGAPATRSA